MANHKSIKDLDMGDVVCEVSTQRDRSRDAVRSGTVRRIYKAAIVNGSFLDCLEQIHEYMLCSGESSDDMAGDQWVVELVLPNGSRYNWYDAVFEVVRSERQVARDILLH
jgi:hypothetical protein